MEHKMKKNTALAITAALITIFACVSCTANTQTNMVPSSSEVATTPVPQTTAPETAVTTIHTEAPETVSITSTEQEKPAIVEQTTTTAPQTTIQTTIAQTEAPKPATTTTAATTKPAPEWTESEVSGTKYVNTSCYSRKKAIIGAEMVALHNVNEKVTVTAKTNTGYFKLSDGSFIHGDYLSDSKVVIQTTTTTTKKQETPPKPAGQTTPQNTFTVYTLGGIGNSNDIYTKIYPDEECKIAVAGYLVGTKLTVVETLADKGLYKLDDGRYVKISDTTKTDPVEKMYYYPFDLEAIKQRIIDHAVNDYGLVYKDDPEWVPEGSSWFPPLVIDKQLSPNVIKSHVESYAACNIEGCMKKGDHFKIYIRYIPIEEMTDSGDQTDGYAIYFLRCQAGDDGNPEYP